jgi:hypothetical protein
VRIAVRMGGRLFLGIALAALLTLGLAAGAFAQTGGSGGSGGAPSAPSAPSVAPSAGSGGSGGSGGTGTTTPPTTSAVNPSGSGGGGGGGNNLANTGLEVGVPLGAAGSLIALALGTRQLARRRIDS